MFPLAHVYIPFIDSSGDVSAILTRGEFGHQEYHYTGNPQDRGREDRYSSEEGNDVFYKWIFNSRESGGECEPYEGNPYIASDRDHITACYYKSIGTGDFNGDGIDDVVVINSKGDLYAVITPEKGGHITEKRFLGNHHKKWDWPLRNNNDDQQSVGIGDVNQDSNDDFVVLSSNGDINAILIPSGCLKTLIFYVQSYQQWIMWNTCTGSFQVERFRLTPTITG